MLAKGRFPSFEFDAFSFDDFKNLHKMKKFNPNNESFSFSENDLPSNFNLNEEESDQNSNKKEKTKNAKQLENNFKKFGIIPIDEEE